MKPDAINVLPTEAIASAHLHGNRPKLKALLQFNFTCYFWNLYFNPKP